MKYMDFYNHLQKKSNLPDRKNEEIANNLIKDYLRITGKKYLNYETGCYAEDIIYEYFLVHKTDDERVLLDLFRKYNFNYSMSIHNAIYYLLATDKEYDSSITPNDWPGINNIEQDKTKYNLDTVLGNIEVYKASEIISSNIFSKNLMGYCYDRTYDFLKENKDYKAINYINFFVKE